MPRTWNAQLEAGFVFVGVDSIPSDPSRRIDSRFTSEMASNFGYSPAEKRKFIDAVKNLYEHSETAAIIIDAAVGWNGTTNTKSFYFIKEGFTDAYSHLNSNAVVLDPAFATTLRFMGLRGTLTADTLEDVLIHEMSHAIVGTPDFTRRVPSSEEVNFKASDYNFPGPNQTIANRVAYEMGLNDFYRTGYVFTFVPPIPPVLNIATTISFSENNMVSGSVYNPFSQNTDLSSNTFPYLTQNYLYTNLGGTLAWILGHLGFGTKDQRPDLLNNKNLLAVGSTQADTIAGNVGSD